MSRTYSAKLMAWSFAVFLACSYNLHGQQVTAAIQGKVLDPSGAPVPNANITAKDLDRGTVSTTVTNADGIYTLPRVPIGRYEVRAEAKGFQTAVNPAVTLELNQAARIDFNMRLGATTETVEV